MSPEKEAEDVAKKIIKRLMRDQYVCQKVSDEELRKAYRREDNKKYGPTERDRRYWEIFG